jgi:hypothetical protein
MTGSRPETRDEREARLFQEEREKPERLPTCSERGFEAFAKGLTAGLIVSAIAIDVQGYSAAMRSFYRGIFPPPELLFPIIANAVRRSMGMGAFAGIFYGGDCQLASIAGHAIDSPTRGAISATAATSVAAVLQQRFSPHTICLGSLACGAAVYSYRHVKENCEIEVRFGFREGD